MQNNALNFECLGEEGFKPFSKVHRFKNGIFMQEYLRNLSIYVLFYCAFFCELCHFL